MGAPFSKDTPGVYIGVPPTLGNYHITDEPTDAVNFVVSGGPQYRPKSTIVLMIGTPKKYVPLILGNPLICIGATRSP